MHKFLLLRIIKNTSYTEAESTIVSGNNRNAHKLPSDQSKENKSIIYPRHHPVT